MPILFQVNVTSVFCLGKQSCGTSLKCDFNTLPVKMCCVLEGTWGNRKKNQYELQKQLCQSQLCSGALRLNQNQMSRLYNRTFHHSPSFFNSRLAECSTPWNVKPVFCSNQISSFHVTLHNNRQAITESPERAHQGKMKCSVTACYYV